MSFGRTLVTFESDFALDESIERLSAATRRPSFAGSPVQAAVGKVEARRVWLVRSIPYVKNSFVPVFKGAFEEEDGRVVLRGSFGMHIVIKVFMSLWFGGLFAMTVPFACRGSEAVGESSVGLLMDESRGQGIDEDCQRRSDLSRSASSKMLGDPAPLHSAVLCRRCAIFSAFTAAAPRRSKLVQPSSRAA